MGIAVGDLFRKTNSTNWVWQVREIFAPAGHCPHARLFRPNDPADERVFSLSALKDKRLFIPVHQSIRAVEGKPLSHREADPAPSTVLEIVRKAS